MVALVLRLLLQLILFSLKIVDLTLIGQDLFAKLKCRGIIALRVRTTTILHVEDAEHAVNADGEEVRV